MKLFTPKAVRRVLYAFPVAIASSALVISFIPQVAHASTPNLPPVSSTQLLSWVEDAQPVPLSGTVRGTTSFPIPAFSGFNSSNPSSAIGGSSTVSYNIWTNAKGFFRVQQLQSANEKDLYITPESVWLWDSSTLTATKEPLSSGNHSTSQTKPNPSTSATQLVNRLSGVSYLSVSGATMVAGRPAYTLSLAPRAADSLIGSIRISVDAQTHIADQIQIFPKGSEMPAASLGFTTLSFSKPQSSIFNFVPPKGSKVTSRDLVASTTPRRGPGVLNSHQAGTTRIVGNGFDSVMISSGSAKVGSLGGLVKNLPIVSIPGGTAHLYSTPIFQALILPNGTVVAGAVATARLLAVARSL